MRVVFLAFLLSAPFAFSQATPAPSNGVTLPLSPASPGAHVLSQDQVREYLRLTNFGEIWRAGWLRSLEMNRSKGEPYWPEAFWQDIAQEMKAVDLVPMVTKLYKPYVSDEAMQKANEQLRSMSIADFAATEFGSRFCKATQLSGPDNEAATLLLTQEIVQRVYERDKPMIKAAREKYLAEHPGYKG